MNTYPQPSAAQPVLLGAPPSTSSHDHPVQRDRAKRLVKSLGQLWDYLRHGQSLSLAGRRRRRLHVAETISLGDKRFVSILEVDGQSLLIGGSSTSLSLLANLAPPASSSFDRVLQDSMHARDHVQ